MQAKTGEAEEGLGEGEVEASGDAIIIADGLNSIAAAIERLARAVEHMNAVDDIDMADMQRQEYL